MENMSDFERLLLKLEPNTLKLNQANDMAILKRFVYLNRLVGKKMLDQKKGFDKYIPNFHFE